MLGIGFPLNLSLVLANGIILVSSIGLCECFEVRYLVIMILQLARSTAPQSEIAAGMINARSRTQRTTRCRGVAPGLTWKEKNGIRQESQFCGMILVKRCNRDAIIEMYKDVRINLGLNKSTFYLTVHRNLNQQNQILVKLNSIKRYFKRIFEAQSRSSEKLMASFL